MFSGKNVIGETLHTTISIFTNQAVSNAFFTHSGEVVSEETHPAVIDARTTSLKLRERTDGRMSFCNASSKIIRFKTFRTSGNTDIFMVEEAIGANLLADVVAVLVLAELALVDLGTLGLGGRVEIEAFDAVEAVGGGSGALSAGRLADFALAVESVVGGRTSADAGIEVQVAQ